MNLIVNSSHCVTIRRLHNHHLTRNVTLLIDQKGNRSKQLALGVSAQLFALAALGCYLIPHDKCDLNSAGLCVEE